MRVFLVFLMGRRFSSPPTLSGFHTPPPMPEASLTPSFFSLLFSFQKAVGRESPAPTLLFFFFPFPRPQFFPFRDLCVTTPAAYTSPPSPFSPLLSGEATAALFNALPDRAAYLNMILGSILMHPPPPLLKRRACCFFSFSRAEVMGVTFFRQLFTQSGSTLPLPFFPSPFSGCTSKLLSFFRTIS